MCDLFYLAVIQTRYRQKWYLRILCKSPIISIKMRFTLWSAIWFVSLIGWTVYFRNRSLPIFKMCRSARKNLSIYDLETSCLGKCLNDHYLRVAMHQTTNEWAQRTSEFLMHLNSWIKIVRAHFVEYSPLNASWGDTFLQWVLFCFWLSALHEKKFFKVLSGHQKTQACKRLFKAFP